VERCVCKLLRLAVNTAALLALKNAVFNGKEEMRMILQIAFKRYTVNIPT